MSYFTAAGNLHMHTPFSDGVLLHAAIAEQAIRAGLDFVIVTDHNVWVDGVEGYYETEQGRVLLLVGEEVHDRRRRPQANHCLIYGAERELSRCAPDPQHLIDETTVAGGFTFLAHPFDPAAPTFGEPSLAWQDWDVEGYTGIEIWNFMSNFKGLLDGKLKTVQAAFRPERHVIGPEEATLRKWDELLGRGLRVAAIGNSDAHGTTYHAGPLSKVVFPYEYLFQAVNTHLVLEDELNGEFERDKRLVLAALGRGAGWVGYDLPASTRGFRFSGQGQNKGSMGDCIRFDLGATLQLLAPQKCRLTLIHNGAAVAEARDEVNLTYLPTEPGAYRAECHINYLGQERGWIYSNPIYLE
ncbi:MAG: CehA/McbA family metallohydrolase [Candidatus Promineifilaceae bacterium]